MTSDEAVEHTPRSAGLHDRINRILHWDVNVVDLEHTIAFYEALTSFRAGEIITDRSGAFRSCLLRNSHRGAPVPTLNLIEWIDPAPVGVPYRDQASIGFFRIVLHVADLEKARSDAISRGCMPVAPTTGDDFVFHLGSVGSSAYQVFAVQDPDGMIVEFIQNPSPKLSVVAQGTGALERNLPFYTDVLGLDLVDTVETPGPVPNVYVPAGMPVEFSGAFFRVRGDDRGYLDWLEHAQVEHRTGPYDVPHHVGVIRCAFEVDDLEAAELTLRSSRWAGREIDIDAESREIDFGSPFGARRVLGFRDPERVSYLLVAQQTYPWALLHPYSRGIDQIGAPIMPLNRSTSPPPARPDTPQPCGARGR